MFVSTLIPTPPRITLTVPAMIKFNEHLTQVINRWAEDRQRIRIIQGHQVFVNQVHKLDESTGLFVETLEFHAEIRKDFTVNRLSVTGWFKLWKFWLQEVRALIAETDWALPNKVSKSEEEDSSGMEELAGPHHCWKSPTTVLDLLKGRM